MAIELSVHPDRALSYFRFSGSVTVQDCARIYRTYVRHPLFDKQFMMLSNTTRLDGIDATFLGIVVAAERLTATFPLFISEARSVIHAANDVTFGMARMMQQIVEPVSRFRFDIHRSEKDALLAAGQREPSFDALDAALGLNLRTYRTG